MRPLWLFLVRNYFVFLFALLEGIAITLFVNNSYYQRAIVVQGTNEVTGFFNSVKYSVTQYFGLKAINDQLTRENAQLRTQQQGSFICTDDSVFTHHDTTYRLQYKYIAAKVLSNTTGKSSNYIMLNKGANHGIQKEMAVICPNGVVGVVNEVSPNFSSVVSLLHPQTKISAKLKRLDYVGTIVWNGNSPFEGNLKDVPIHVKVKVGDTIVTSGYSLLFPEGILIGTVKSFKIGTSNDFYEITVKLSTDFNNLKYVYIISNLMRDEMEALEKKSQKKK